MGEVYSSIIHRRSVRDYKQDKPSKQEITTMLEAARWAPSGKNGQPWRFVVVMEDEEIRTQLAKCSVYRAWLSKAPCMIAVFLDKSASYDHEKDLQAVGAAIQNILLAGHEMGIGTCWVGEILRNEEKIKSLLNVREEQQLMAVIAVGYANKAIPDGKRNDLDQMTLSWI